VTFSVVYKLGLKVNIVIELSNSNVTGVSISMKAFVSFS
jgi:hypothetical protein